MLGTLEEYQRSDWKAHVPISVHAFNVTIHDSTVYSSYFLMFGRHPRLVIDAFLGLSPDPLSAIRQETPGTFAVCLSHSTESGAEKCCQAQGHLRPLCKEIFMKATEFSLRMLGYEGNASWLTAGNEPHLQSSLSEIPTFMFTRFSPKIPWLRNENIAPKCHRGERGGKSIWPDQNSNPGPLAYRVSTLTTELPSHTTKAAVLLRLFGCLKSPSLDSSFCFHCLF